jgi:hypothetical protein
MKMFSEGDAALPALGMEEIPKQLANHLLLPILFVQYYSSRHSSENTIFTNLVLK